MITDFNAWRSNCFGNKMHSPKRIKITDVNPHLLCVLCGGYYIDATTVIECFHSFCKSCIVKYLEKNKYCPICDVLIHKTSPLLNIRPDKTLQNVVYKLVPSLFKNEMQRRVEFYQKHPDSPTAIPEQRGEISDSTPLFFPDELLIICLQHQGFHSSHPVNQRYLHCPAALPVSHLIKLIKGKYNLNSKHQVYVYFKDDLLMEHITLMDVAYTYQCRRKEPIQLTFKIMELKTKRIRIINREPAKEDLKKEKVEEKEWKEVQLQISENGVMSVRNVESCECSPIPAVEAPPVYSPSMSSSSASHLMNNSLLISQADPATKLTSDTEPSSIKMITSEINVDTLSPSTTSQSFGSSTLVKPAVVNPPPDLSVSSPLPMPSTISSTASPITSPEVTVVSSATSITSTTIVSTCTSRMSPAINSATPQTHSLVASPISSNTITSLIPSASFSPSSTSSTVASPLSCINFTTTILSSPISTSFVSNASKSIFTTCVSSISSPLISQSVTVTTHPITSVATQITSSVASLSLPNTTSSVNTFPALPGSPAISLPHLLIGSNVHSSSGLESCIVTTMAGMKPATNLVPSSFPIMSSCRPQNEPIVSVSKVSKDQVRKPNNIIEVNKLSISRVPPGGMKEKGDNLNKIVNKLSPNERIIGNTSVTIRPVTNNPNPLPKMYPITRPLHSSSPTSVAKEKQQVRYKTLKSPTKQWNPSIDRATQMQLMKQNTDQSKPPRFFKMRNMPRFLGNPASGVKPLYACPDDPVPNQTKQKLTLMKVDPKTIPTSSIPRSPTKQPPPYTPGSPKMNKPPPAYPDPKAPYLNQRMPSPAHAGSFLPPNPYHLLYSSYSSFSPDSNPMLSPELIRSMCAYHPSLPPTIGMLFNPGMHAAIPRSQDNYKSESTPAVQRIPPSKTDTPPPPKPLDDKRFPSPVGLSENKKLTHTPPPISPKEVEKPLVSQESKSKSPVPAVEPSPQVLNAEVKENHSELTSDKPNVEESNVVKMNCDDININNNNSKESPPSQPSECLANRPQ